MMNKIGMSLSRLWLLVFGGIYLLVFVWTYAEFIVPRFSWQHFTYSPVPERNALALALSLLPLLWMPLYIDRPSVLAVWVLYFLVYVPSVVVGFHVLSVSNSIPLFFWVLLGSMLLLSLLPLMPRVLLPRVYVPRDWVITGVMGIWGGGYLYLLKIFGLRSLPTLSRIYAVRLAARSVLSSHAGIIGYLMRWLNNAFNPFFMAIGIQKRKWIFLGLGILGELLIFSFDATKSTLMSVFYLLGLYAVLRWKRWRFPAVLLFVGAIALFGLALAVDLGFHSFVMRTYLLRRVFYMPGLLSALYYEYFSSHPHWYWAHTAFGRILGLLPPPGEVAKTPSFLIGEVYFHNPAGNANVNVWGDAFANMGNYGVVLVTFGLFLLLWLYDSVSLDHDPALVYFLAGMPIFALTNSAFLTVILTHGWLAAILLLWLWPPEKFVAKRYVQEGGEGTEVDGLPHLIGDG